MPTNASADAELPQHVFRWLEATQRRVGLELDAALDAEARRLGPRRLRILQLIPPGGARQRELSERALVTKQAIADFVDGLENDGLVERRPDPEDGRAWLVVRTPRGEKVCDGMDAAMQAVETDLARVVGAERYRTFLGVLKDLGAGQI